MLAGPFLLAAESALALVISHTICCSIVMYFDLTGKWDNYKLHKTRCVSVQDYLDGAKSFVADLFLLFLPFLTFCYYFREQDILGMFDTSLSLFQIGARDTLTNPLSLETLSTQNLRTQFR